MTCWLALVLLVACQGGATARPQAPAAQPSAQASAAPKRIVAAIRGEPKTLVVAVDSAGAGQTKGLSEVEQLVNAGLGVIAGDGTLQPRLAEQAPTLENGGWRLEPDGRMETTWTIRPNATWADGAPVTSADIAFTVRVGSDRELPITRDQAFDEVEGVDTPDARTVVVRWKRPFIEADRLLTHTLSTNVMPMPSHILERPYEEDHAGFMDLPYWSDGFVGAGPFKLRDWVVGSHLLLEAHDGYVLGRPKIDTIEVQFIGDPSVTMASVLAGTLDLTLRGGLSFEQGQSLREQWQRGRVEGSVSALTSLFPQFLNPNPAAVADVRFRRAVTSAMDRQQLIDALQPGSQVGDSSINPRDPEYPAVESSIVRYGYDPRKAVDLITEMGFSRGADGTFRDGEGQKLAVKIQTTTDDLRQKLILAIANYWQQAGVETETVVIPRQAASDRQLRATFPGFDSTQSPSTPTRYHSSGIPLPENGFRGNNRSRYSSPEMDALIEKYLVTIPMDERLPLLAAMVHHMTDQLVTIGIFYLVEPVAISNRLANVTAVQGENGVLAWSAHEWDVTEP